jgi:anaphase-promoting complex subunit 4
MASFSGPMDYKPMQMQVVDRNNSRGDIPGRICIVGQDKVTCKVYELPGGWQPQLKLPTQDITME